MGISSGSLFTLRMNPCAGLDALRDEADTEKDIFSLSFLTRRFRKGKKPSEPHE